MLDLLILRILAWATGARLFKFDEDYPPMWVFQIDDKFGTGLTPKRAVQLFLKNGGKLETPQQRAKSKQNATTQNI